MQARTSAPMRRTIERLMHRLTLGDFELTAVSDGTYRLDGGAFFGVIPKVMWGKK